MGCGGSTQYSAVAPHELSAPHAVDEHLTGTTEASPAVDPAVVEPAFTGLTKVEDGASTQYSVAPHELSAKARARVREAEGFGVHLALGEAGQERSGVERAESEWREEGPGAEWSERSQSGASEPDTEPAFTKLTQADGEFSWLIAELAGRQAPTEVPAIRTTVLPPPPSPEPQDWSEQLVSLDLSLLRVPTKTTRRSFSDKDVPASIILASGGPMLPPPSHALRRWTSDGGAALQSLALTESHSGSGLLPNRSGASLSPSSGLSERYADSANYAELQWGPAARGLTEPMQRRYLAVVP
ncbi:hypothetical protein T492DRAFT_971052 [Pavlovales sp. CCMP2436]|nr:hypothetical protein T492DRAFT_971052 [Pavlovales sp. CCMP2436]